MLLQTRQQRDDWASSLDRHGNSSTERKGQFSGKKLKAAKTRDVNHGEIKIAVMKKLHKIQENPKGRSVSSEIKLMKGVIYQRDENYKNKLILGLKNSINKIKNGHFNNNDTQ